MNLKIIEGHFSNTDAITLISQMIEVKIKFHEQKIGSHTNFEDIKMRENRIKKLQHDLTLVNNYLKNNKGNVGINCDLSLS